MFCEFEGRNGRKVIGEVVMDEVRLKRLADRMQNLDEWACFDGETEILTELGWMRLDKYVELETYPKVLSYDRGILQFKPVKRVIKKKHKGDMIRIQNKSVDMYMTPDHKVIHFKDGEKHVTMAQDVSLDSDSRIVVAGIRNLGYKTLSNMDRLLIAISADGHYVEKEDVYTFSFIKQRKIERLQYLLDSLGIDYTCGEHHRKGRMEKWFRIKLPKYIQFKKGLHNIIKLQDVSTNYAIEFLKEVALWDGSVHTNSDNTLSYNTANKEEADFYSAMCVLANAFAQKTVHSHGVFKTGCNLTKNDITLTGTKETIPFDGEVYCVQVPDTRCFFARRGMGTPFLTHNCDTETNTLRVQCAGEMKLVGISICFGENDTYYIPTGHYFDEGQLDVETVVKYLKPIFERKDVRIIIQNAKYDLHVMENIGIKIQTDDIFDTMLASWLIDENESKGLKEMTSRKYGIAQTHFDECLNTVTKEEKKMLGLKASNKAEFWMVRIENGAPYALADAYWTWRHYVDWQMDDLEKENMLTIYRKMFVPFLKTVYNMERRGVRVDIPKLQDMQKRAEKDLADMEYRMIEIAGVEFSPTSSQQLAELLFGYEKFNKKGEFAGNAHILAKSFNFPVVSTTEGGAPQTGDYQLEQLLKQTYKRDKRKQEGLELIKILQDYKKLAKIKSAFIDGLLAQVYADGKVHPTIGVAGADSGRVTCSNPNLNQLPRPVEFNPPMSFEEWQKANGKEIEDTLDIEEYLVMDKGYPTGEVHDEAYTYGVEPYEEYLEYLKEWRAKNEKAVFWKSYEIRDCFIPDNPDEEVVLAGDFSNLEMVMLAHFSNDERLCTTFKNGDDAHGATAVNMFNLDCTPKEVKKKYPALRQISKAINFGLH